MSVRLQRNIPEITNFIENIALYNQNFDTYEDFEGWYNKRTEDTDEFKYIMEIYDKISSGTDTISFTYAEIQEFEDKFNIINSTPRFPDFIVKSLSELLQKLKMQIIKQEYNNLKAGEAAGILESNPNKLNRLHPASPALSRLMGMPAFTTSVGQYLTREPRIVIESKGTIRPAIENLKKRARGELPDPIVNRSLKRPKNNSSRRTRKSRKGRKSGGSRRGSSGGSRKL